MFAKKFNVINKYSSYKTMVLSVPIHSDDICLFSRYYKYYLTKIKHTGDEELLLDYSVIKNFFGVIRSTILPYDEALQEISMNEIGELFDKLLNTGVIEDGNYLKKFGLLIGKFFRNESPNLLEKKLNEIYHNFEGKKTIVSHFIREANQDKYIFNQVNRCLSQYEYYDYLFFLGTPSFYDEKISVLKCSNAFFLGYDIFTSSFENKLIFSGNIPQNSRVYSHIEISDSIKEKDSYKESQLDFDHFDFTPRISEEIKMKHEKKELDEYTQKAKMLKFVSNNFMFLPVGGKVSVINRDKFCVEQITTNSVEAGDWVIVRRSSDEEYIRSKAKQFVGSNYSSMINTVTEYKRKLKKMIYQRKLTVEQIRIMFSQSEIEATTQQIREWIFGATILPRPYRQILKFLGYTEGDIDTIKIYYDEIMNAHKRAGRELSNNTNEILNNLDKEAIIKEMRHMHNYFIEIESIGGFSIVEVLYLSIDDINVESGSLYRLINFQNKVLGGTDSVGAKYFK
ncbi:hypothetical protein [Enterococcus casseliflavus]|uniref:hypothetical protein n=1 Tax=Enterococcus casseliflavus TaxID=37734 RepID=UPI003D6A7C0F